MLNYNKITELIDEKVSNKETFYSIIGMTRIGFTNMIKNKSMKVDTLEKIAAHFQEPVGCFFNEVNTQVPQEINIDFKEKYYELLEKYNACLEHQAIQKNSSVYSTAKISPKLK